MMIWKRKGNRRGPDKAISVQDEEGAREVPDIIGSQVNHLHRVSGLKVMEQRLLFRLERHGLATWAITLV